MKLFEAVSYFRANLDALADMDLDEQTYADTLESMTGEVEAKLRAVIAYSLELDIEADGAAAASKRMKERADSLAKRRDWLQRYALDAMQATGIGSVSTDEFAAKVAKTPARVVITNIEELPADYMRVKYTSEPDKTALKEALQAGAAIEGVSLVSGYRLAIK
jgi:hypothetical protein